MENPKLYPNAEGIYRPTYVYEFCRMFKSSDSCNVDAVYPYNVVFDSESVGVDPEKLSSDTFSPFLSYTDFVNQISMRV